MQHEWEEGEQEEEERIEVICGKTKRKETTKKIKTWVYG
jgi:hypothetical protein